MMNPIEFLPSALLCLHKLSIFIESQFKRVENKKKNCFFESTPNIGNTGQQVVPENYYDNVPWVTRQIIIKSY